MDMFDLVDYNSWGPLTGVFVVLGTTLIVSSLALAGFILYAFWSDPR